MPEMKRRIGANIGTRNIGQARRPAPRTSKPLGQTTKYSPRVSRPLGQSSYIIKKVQQRLYELGYNDVLVSSSRKKDGTWDGILGQGTMATIKKFQQDRGLQVTGMPDNPTLQALGILSTPTPPIPTPPNKEAIIEWVKKNAIWVGIVLMLLTIITIIKKEKK